MKYMLLMNANRNDLASFGTMSPDEIVAHLRFMDGVNAELKASGEWVVAEGLTMPDQAKLVRARNDGPPVTDGPFPESKEFLAGFWILDCKSLERAIEIAAKVSAAPGRGGAPMNFPVELRPVGVAPEH
ncbi:MAG TPA: YciI family protein [Polyangiaceae bacterium]|nr:YciI family protein [Polyangiaceae bacterium]